MGVNLCLFGAHINFVIMQIIMYSSACLNYLGLLTIRGPRVDCMIDNFPPFDSHQPSSLTPLHCVINQLLVSLNFKYWGENGWCGMKMPVGGVG